MVAGNVLLRDGVQVLHVRSCGLEAGGRGFKPQFFPRLPAITQLFSQPATAASLVVHVLSINLFLGRQIYLE
ncbi:uncharacterized protein HaLaN_13258, partial [Haematococcus lacustris]